MSYIVYTTKALVCGSFEQNTSDKSFLLFTRDAGMLFATARGVREERSKQRHALQDFSRIRVSLIKGKSSWRIGSVEVEKNDFSLAKDRYTRGSVVMLHKMLRRFIHGEEIHLDLFDFVVSALDELNTDQPNRELLDLFIQARILSILGYVDKDAVSVDLDIDISRISSLQKGDSYIPKLKMIVEKAMESSHL